MNKTISISYFRCLGHTNYFTFSGYHSNVHDVHGNSLHSKVGVVGSDPEGVGGNLMMQQDGGRGNKGDELWHFV